LKGKNQRAPPKEKGNRGETSQEIELKSRGGSAEAEAVFRQGKNLGKRQQAGKKKSGKEGKRPMRPQKNAASCRGKAGEEAKRGKKRGSKKRKSY